MKKKKTFSLVNKLKTAQQFQGEVIIKGNGQWTLATKIYCGNVAANNW